MKIMIDPGHRNNINDFGATGNGLKESTLALSISKKIQIEFKNNGYIAELTRNSESETIGINQRPYKAKQNGCQWLISIHVNSASNPTATGVEVCYKSQKNMADVVSAAMSEATGLRNRGAKQRTDLGVLNGFDKSILIECGFINNPAESKKLSSNEFQNKLAYIIVETFLKELKLPLKENNSELVKQVQEAYKFDDNTMKYLVSYKYADDLMQAFLIKKPLSNDSRIFILKYKFGKEILNKVYG